MTVEQKLAFQEASSAGVKSMEHLIRLVSHEPIHVDCREITNFAVSKLNKAISTLDRTGHARFRRGPVQVPDAFSSLCLSMEKDTLELAPLCVAAPVKTELTLNSFTSLCLSPRKEKDTLAHAPFSVAAPMQTELTLDFTKSNVNFAVAFDKMENPKSSSSFLSSITTGEGSVSNGKQVGSSSPMLLLPVAQAVSVGKQLSATGKRCREHENSDDVSGKCSCKKRKSRSRKVIRIPAISSRIADIPADEFTWRKYGQKPIKGSAYPRGYYKCSSVRGCPARKHVERAMDDPAILIVTYEDEHCHTQVAM